jgi:hypothetical protein
MVFSVTRPFVTTFVRASVRASYTAMTGHCDVLARRQIEAP